MCLWSREVALADAGDAEKPAADTMTVKKRASIDGSSERRDTGAGGVGGDSKPGAQRFSI